MSHESNDGHPHVSLPSRRSVLAIFVALLAGCGASPTFKRLHFVVPVGFRGPFALVNRAEGITLDEANKSHRVEVPRSGIVTIADADALQEGREWSASFADGAPLPFYEARNDEIALHGGGFQEGSHIEPRYVFFVGTRKEFGAFDSLKWHQC